jgi:hypothetical protein
MFEFVSNFYFSKTYFSKLILAFIKYIDFVE